MPGALDVLVEIQFSANDSVLKEINSQLEKESNILKTIEERLQQLNSAASGQGAIAAQLKLINKEIEQMNRLLIRMQTSYKEVDYAGEALKKQKNHWAHLALAIRQAPDATSKFKAGLYEVIAMLPELSHQIAVASRSGTAKAKDHFLKDIIKLHDSYTAAKAKILAKDAVLNNESIELAIEAERTAAFEKLHLMIEAKRKERQLTAAEEEEIAKTRVAINSKYNFELLKELDSYNKKKTELGKSISKLQTENDKNELLRKKG